MTANRIEKLNEVIDDIYTMMLATDYDRATLNKIFLHVNLIAMMGDREAYSKVFETLSIINEQKENYEICSFIQVMAKKLKIKND